MPGIGLVTRCCSTPNRAAVVAVVVAPTATDIGVRAFCVIRSCFQARGLHVVLHAPNIHHSPGDAKYIIPIRNGFGPAPKDVDIFGNFKTD
jgi:hypothetical protein